MQFPFGNHMVPRRKNKVAPPPVECPLNECMSILDGKWTPHIVWYLSHGPRRFTELKQDIPGISAKTLTARLQKLTRDGVLVRADMPTSPPTVEYSLSQLGVELKPAIEAIVNVGHRLKESRRR
jgi:DNA-binding HxlR family transcriptional regulator